MATPEYDELHRAGKLRSSREARRRADLRRQRKRGEG